MMNKKSLFSVKEKAEDILKRVSSSLASAFLEKEFSKTLKGVADFQTTMDVAVEKTIHDNLATSFPDWGFRGEEGINDNANSDYFWVLDPICSTNNFVFGLPLFGTALGLLHKEEVIFSCLCFPVLDKFLWAIKDKGAFLDDKRVNVSRTKKLKDSLILYDNQFYRSDKMIPNLLKLAEECFTLRITGSAAYDMFCVATGIAEARVFHKTKFYDFIPASLIIEESGGRITNFMGKRASFEESEVLVSNGFIHSELLKTINKGR